MHSETKALASVGSVMKESVLTVAPTQKLSLAMQMMLWGNVRHLPVLEGGKLVGLVSERDVLRCQHLGPNAPIAKIMSAPVQTADQQESVQEAAARMSSAGIGCLPVVDGDALAGIVTSTDLLTFLARPVELADGRVQPEARDVMSGLIISFGPDADVLDVVAAMVRERIRHVPIVDDQRRVIGIVSDRDLRTAVGDLVGALRERDETASERWPIATVMTSQPATIRPDAALDEVAACFVDESLGALPVVDAEGRLVGMVSYVDLLRFAYRDGWSDLY
jgi:CBS-domain-containing membrane protein